MGLACAGALLAAQLRQPAVHPPPPLALPQLLLPLALRLPQLPLALFCAHLARRLLECLLLHRWGAAARMPLHLWLAGVAHYVLVPFSLVPSGCGGGSWRERQPAAALLLLAAGVAAFLTGNAAQHAAHRQLAAMRRPRAAALSAAHSPARPVCAEGAAAAASTGGGRGTAGDAGAAAAAPCGVARNRRAQQPPRGRQAGSDSAAAGALPCGGSSSGSSGSAGGGSGSGSRGGGGADDYPLPEGGLFGVFLAPHFTAEVALYAGLAACVYSVAGGPPSGGGCGAEAADALRGAGPLLLAAWVAGNLGATAQHTRAWYVERHPARAAEIAGRRGVLGVW